MSNLRFVLIAVALFGFAFVGVTYGLPWASKGFPAMAARVASVTPETPAIAASVKPEVRDDWASKAPPIDSDVGRNQLRMTAIQAADAYARAPCEQAVKAAFIVSASTYVRAVTGEGGKAFSTPADLRVRKSIEAAVEAGGISRDEFPSGTQLWAAAFAKPAGAPLCGGRQAERRTH